VDNGRKDNRTQKGAAIAVIALLALVLGWAGGGQLAGALRALSSAEGRLAIRPEDVPACGPAWRLVDNPSPSREYNELHSIAAVSPEDVWVVGVHGAEQSAQTLVERWDGRQWTQVPSPSAPGYSNHMHGMSVASARDIWAVGAYHREADFWQTLAMRWDGTQWGVVPSPNPAPISILNAVVAISADDAWAVGEYSRGSRGNGSQPLIVRWDGSAWKEIPAPRLAGGGVLNAVVALSPDDVWAGGSRDDRSGTLPGPLVMHWDGSAWSVVDAPGAGTIWGMAAVSAEDIWAVGNNGPQTLTMRWDGTRWSTVSSPNPGRNTNTLNAVAYGPGEVWVVGAQNDGEADKALAMRWDGARWNPVPIPSAGTILDTLYSVAATPTGIWAAGSYVADPSGTTFTLIERYSNPCVK
jgi:hypothetical protein